MKVRPLRMITRVATKNATKALMFGLIPSLSSHLSYNLELFWITLDQTDQVDDEV